MKTNLNKKFYFTEIKLWNESKVEKEAYAQAKAEKKEDEGKVQIGRQPLKSST